MDRIVIIIYWMEGIFFTWRIRSEWKVRNNGQSQVHRVVGKGVGKFRRRWKEPSEVGKNRVKLERTDWSLKEPNEVGKNRLSNFSPSFLTSDEIFQLRSILSNFAWLFPTSAKLSNFRLSNFFLTGISNYTFYLLTRLELFNFWIFPTPLSNFTHVLSNQGQVCSNRLNIFLCLIVLASVISDLKNMGPFPRKLRPWIPNHTTSFDQISP